MKMRDLCANKREIKYKKEERPKMSLLSKRELIRLGEKKKRKEEEEEKRREEEEKRRRRAKKVSNSKVLYGFP